MSEAKKFTIGEFTFDTFHEYRDAQEDLKKIELINGKLDVHDPEVAVKLYGAIRDGSIHFRSPIGAQFSDHISDIVAESNIGLLEDKAVVDEAEGKVKYQKYIGVFVAALGVILFAYFGVSELKDYLTTKRLGQLAEQVETSGSAAGGSATAGDGADYSISAGNPFAWSENIKRENLVILPEYQPLVEANSDTVGWLRIPGTDVNYPVVQQADNNEYYLKRSFDKEEDSNGTLFVDYRSDIVNQNSNTIIYGHNMKNGLMFGSLDQYLDEDFFNTHRTVSFNTIYEKRDYEIIAVCLSKVEYQDANAYRYYNFIQANNRAEWQAFLNNVKSLSVYDFDPASVLETDKFLTLSTCNNYIEDGRLFIVAKRIK